MEKSLHPVSEVNITVKNPITGSYLSEKDYARIQSFFEFVYLIHPEEVAANPVIHPEFVRFPDEKGVYSKPKNLSSTLRGRKWSRYVEIEGKEYRAAKNNVRAKYAFKDYTNVNLTDSKKSSRLYGYTVAHIFGGANNPQLFSAGFNLALINDGFVKFTDEQHLEPLIYWALTSAAFLLNKDTIKGDQSLSSLPSIGPLIPKVKGGKFVKKNHRIEFQLTQPFAFWFPIRAIKKNAEDYSIELITC